MVKTVANIRIRGAHPVDQAPLVHLQLWKIYEVTTWDSSRPTRHFVGYNLDDRGGQVSSAITQFNRGTLTGSTISGRVYQLFNEPGLDPISELVWQAWCTRFQVCTQREINPKSWLSWYL